MEPESSPVVAPVPVRKRRLWWRVLVALMVLSGSTIATLMFLWSTPPERFDPVVQAKNRAGGKELLIGTATAATLARC